MSKSMELILWRHAEAQEAAAGLPDLERQLTPRGEKQAQLVARWLDKHLPESLHIIASPAIRCQQTVRPLARRFATDPRIGPGASAGDLLAAAGWRGSGERHGSASLIVGHQPTLGRLAAWLLTGQESDWTIRKGALWWFSCRAREGGTQTILRAVIDPDMLEK